MASASPTAAAMKSKETAIVTIATVDDPSDLGTRRVQNILFSHLGIKREHVKVFYMKMHAHKADADDSKQAYVEIQAQAGPDRQRKEMTVMLEELRKYLEGQGYDACTIRMRSWDKAAVYEVDA